MLLMEMLARNHARSFVKSFALTASIFALILVAVPRVALAHVNVRTPTPSSTPTRAPSVAPTPAPLAAVPTITPTATATATWVPEATPSPTATPTPDRVDVPRDIPITGAEAEREGMLPQRPYDMHQLYVDPPMPTIEAQTSPSPTATPALTAKKNAPPAETPGQAEYRRTRDTSYLEPTSWSISVFKKKHQLIVYYKGRMYKIYHAVFGRSFEVGTKLWEGDRRTPEGVYTIIEKHPSRRWEWFLTLNYPNIVDLKRYDQLRDGGVVPVEDGRPVGVGGRIGIHGTDVPLFNKGNFNWTTGCISVDNADINQLYKLLPVGTVVIIKP